MWQHRFGLSVLPDFPVASLRLHSVRVKITKKTGLDFVCLFCFAYLCVFFHFSSSQYHSFPQTTLKHVIQNCLQRIIAWTEVEGVKSQTLQNFSGRLHFFLRTGNDWMFDYIIFYLPMKFLLPKGCDRITVS